MTSGSLESRCYQVVRQLAEAHRQEIDRRFPKVLRRVGGYNLDEFTRTDRPFNLAKLMVGSEGTLGVVLSAKVNLVPLPKAKAVLAIQFADLLESLSATPLILTHGPSAVEVMDKSILDYTRQSAALEAVRQSFISGDPGALLCVEFYAETADELRPRLVALERDLRARGFGYHYHHALDAPAQARIWSLREAGLGLSMAMKDDAKSLSFVEDTAVAPERLRDFIDRFLTIVRAHGTTAGVYAHASVGCLHRRRRRRTCTTPTAPTTRTVKSHRCRGGRCGSSRRSRADTSPGATATKPRRPGGDGPSACSPVSTRGCRRGSTST
jgi:hypothetical protein